MSPESGERENSREGTRANERARMRSRPPLPPTATWWAGFPVAPMSATGEMATAFAANPTLAVRRRSRAAASQRFSRCASLTEAKMVGFACGIGSGESRRNTKSRKRSSLSLGK